MRKVFLVVLLIGLLVVISGCTQQVQKRPTTVPSPTQTPFATSTEIVIETPIASPSPTSTQSPSPILYQTGLIPSDEVCRQGGKLIPSGGARIRGAETFKIFVPSNYEIYATQGSNNTWATIAVKTSLPGIEKDPSGKILDTQKINQGETKEFGALGFSVELVQIDALENGSVLETNIKTYTPCPVNPSPTQSPSPTPITTPTPTTSPTIDKDTAIQKLTQAGCGYNLSQESVCIVFDDPNWVLQKYGCAGTCKLDSVTSEIKIYSNPMCTGLLRSNECQTDADCSTKTGLCAIKFVCESTSCVPVFK